MSLGLKLNTRHYHRVLNSYTEALYNRRISGTKAFEVFAQLSWRMMPGKLGCRQSTTIYDGRSVMVMTLREATRVRLAYRDVSLFHPSAPLSRW